MYGDTYRFEPHQIPKAKWLSKFIHNAFQSERVVIAIYGVSGTSKSEITYKLQEFLLALGISAYSISIDDYFLTHPTKREIIRKDTGVIGHKEINWEKLNKVVKGFRNKEETWVQEYYLFIKQLRHIKINFNQVQVLIVEGIYAGYLKDFNLGIYLDASYKDTYKFRKRRGKENPDDEFRQKVLKIEATEILKTKKKSHIIVEYNGACRYVNEEDF